MHGSPVEIHLVGVSIRESGLDVLERVVKTVPLALSDFFGDRPKGYGVCILSTCNRFEIYSLAPKDVADLLMGLFYDAGVNPDTLFVASGEKAIRHLIEVACGIHSWG
jgi:glutamyl-tRNA reductase